MAQAAWQIEPLTHERLGAVAEVHGRAFRGYFLANLGPRFLRLYYDDFVGNPIAIGLVAVEEATGRPLGAVVGNTDGMAFYRLSVRRHMGRKMLLAFGRLFCSLRLWGQAAVRVGRALKRLARRLLGRRPEGPPDDHKDTPVRLLSIGVVPEARGTGLAAALIRAFEQEAAARGADRVGLTCFEDNDRAIRFYEKSGWERVRTWRGTVAFEKRLTPPGG